MPDLMSHLLIALILAELFNIKKKSIVALGALLPDILSKWHLVYVHLNLPVFFSFVPFHTPSVIFLISMLMSPLFRYDKLKFVLFLNLGAMSHFVSDITIKHFAGYGVRVFFPLFFIEKNFALNLIWPEQSIYVLIASLFIYMVIRILKKNMSFKNIKTKVLKNVFPKN